MSDTWQIIFTAIGSLGGLTGLLALILQWRNRRAEARKVEADADKVYVERKALEEEITERVLERARVAMNGLSSENETLKKKVEALTKENTTLAKKVKDLEDRCKVMQAEYDAMALLVDELQEAIKVLCKQLKEGGLEPAYEPRTERSKD